MNDQSNEFDYTFYTEFYSELAELTNEQAFFHWQTVGQFEGRYGNQDEFLQKHDLNAQELPLDFSVEQYLKCNPDVNVDNPYFATLHYLKYGRYENRNYTDDLSKIVYDGFIGRNILGWALCHNQGKQKVNLRIGNCMIGSISADFSRADVADHLHLLFNTVGYNHDIGALLQFLALTSNLLNLSLELNNYTEKSIALELPVENSITFSPMSVVLENRNDHFPYYANRIRLIANQTLEITLSGMDAVSLKGNFLITLYQLHDNQLTCIGFKYCSEDENVKISVSLLNCEDPVLFVVTDKKTNALIYTDCIPYPILFHSDYELIIELHGLYVGRQSPLKVIRKLERNWLEFKVKTLYPELATSSEKCFPTESETSVVFYSRNQYAITDIQFLPNWQHLGKSAYLLEAKSNSINLIDVSHCTNHTDDKNSRFNSFEEISSQYLLFYDLESSLRADYWAIIRLYSKKQYKAISGNNIVYDGISSPNYISHKPLTNGIKGNLLESHCVLFDKTIVEEYAKNVSSSKFIPENIISSLNESDLFHLRIPISSSKSPFLLLGGKEKNLAIKERISFQNKESLNCEKSDIGFSVIINFRDFVEVTKKSILALRIQNYSSDIEVILVNNSSHPSSRSEIEFYAISLFGTDAVKIIDYPHTFNHSLQSNLAVKSASYPLLLMLSNDAFLLSPNCLSRAADILKNESVATCGFRILRNTNGNHIVESIGLRLALGQLCSLGGQLLKRNIPLEIDSDKTLRVAGNTFAAVAVRKEVYEQLDGLNEVDFPTNYNDVDFCLRASRLQLLHVALGDCIVEHSGRGSREPDLDFPVNPLILKSLENVNELSDGYSTYNFGNTLIF